MLFPRVENFHFGRDQKQIYKFYPFGKVKSKKKKKKKKGPLIKELFPPSVFQFSTFPLHTSSFVSSPFPPFPFSPCLFFPGTSAEIPGQKTRGHSAPPALPPVTPLGVCRSSLETPPICKGDWGRKTWGTHSLWICPGGAVPFWRWRVCKAQKTPFFSIAVTQRPLIFYNRMCSHPKTP